MAVQHFVEGSRIFGDGAVVGDTAFSSSEEREDEYEIRCSSADEPVAAEYLADDPGLAGGMAIDGYGIFCDGADAGGTALFSSTMGFRNELDGYGIC